MKKINQYANLRILTPEQYVANWIRFCGYEISHQNSKSSVATVLVYSNSVFYCPKREEIEMIGIALLRKAFVRYYDDILDSVASISAESLHIAMYNIGEIDGTWLFNRTLLHTNDRSPINISGIEETRLERKLIQEPELIA